MLHRRTGWPVWVHSIVSNALTLCLLLPASRAADELELQVPQNASSCETLSLSWTGGTPNFTIAVLAPLDASQTFLHVPDRSVQWFAKVRGGTDVTMEVSDSAGRKETSTFSVTPGGNTTCLNASETQLPHLPDDSTPIPLEPAPTTPPLPDSDSDSRTPLVVGLSIGAFVLVALLSWYMKGLKKRVRDEGACASSGAR